MQTQDYTIRAKPVGGTTPKMWLEGARLEYAGFTPGRFYRAFPRPDLGGITLELSPSGARKVSGREGKKPIIELTGRILVEAELKPGDHVQITYHQQGHISVRKIAAELAVAA